MAGAVHNIRFTFFYDHRGTDTNYLSRVVISCPVLSAVSLEEVRVKSMICAGPFSLQQVTVQLMLRVAAGGMTGLEQVYQQVNPENPGLAPSPGGLPAMAPSADQSSYQTGASYQTSSGGNTSL